jgi:hypothetical protein
LRRVSSFIFWKLTSISGTKEDGYVITGICAGLTVQAQQNIDRLWFVAEVGIGAELIIAGQRE